MAGHFLKDIELAPSRPLRAHVLDRRTTNAVDYVHQVITRVCPDEGEEEGATKKDKGNKGKIPET